MNIEEIREYCLSKKATTESFPFDEDTLVFKVMGKMFCLTSLSEGDSINLKCDPEKAIELRDHFDCVQPGYHMNKKMWNTVLLDGSVSKKVILQWIDHSYDEVVKKLPKKDRIVLGY
ncbi:MAG: MmcQ/YjbR family DNA-binding protein [Bacteroidota bacterium]|nr:MmcQ/YjbR family DNA-binding protein [Bacteroidota bacterium]